MLDGINMVEEEDLKDIGFDADEVEQIERQHLEKLKTIEEEIVPYKKVHILFSFHPKKFIEVSGYIEKIKNIVGIECEQSAN